MNSFLRDFFIPPAACRGESEDRAASFGLYELFLLLLYAGGIAFLASHHEVWRDEVRALSIIRESETPWHLLANIRNEGHPFLWYLFLWFGHALASTPLVLKIVSALTAVFAAFLFLRSPYFSRLEKTLWLPGVLPLYEFSVQCRNYGIGMLFLFAYCALYSKRLRNPIGACAILFLLANTSYYGFLFSASLLALLIFESAFRWRAVPNRSDLFCGFLLSVAGLGAAALQMYPDSTTLVTEVHDTTPTELLHLLWHSITSPGAFATDAFSLRYDLHPLYFVFPAALLIASRPIPLLFLLMIVFGMTLSHHLVYTAEALRHQGFLVLSVIAAFWIFRSDDTPSLWETGTARLLLQQFLLVILFLFQIDSAFLQAGKDLRRQMTPAPAVGAFIKSQQLQNAIIIAEPDYYAESIPYYAPNRIYLPREGRFRDVVLFTERNKKSLRMRELVQTARKLHRTHNSPVLLLYGHTFQEPGVHEFSYGKEFRFTENERSQFRKRFKLLKYFGEGVTDEAYNLYRYRPKNRP